jgi:Uncharacterized conserved protein
MQVLNKGLYPIKHWTDFVPFEQQAIDQLINLSNLPFIHKHIAVMPDVHAGLGSTVGTVIATKEAIIPAAVGVDIGCGMAAYKTNLKAPDLPDNLAQIRSDIEEKIPVGFNIRENLHLVGNQALFNKANPQEINDIFEAYGIKYTQKHKKQLGTLGGGNHFIEICLDESSDVWVMLHSGSRGIGNTIGSVFIEKAKEEVNRWFIHLPDNDLAYLPEGSKHFDSYIKAMMFAQDYASINRDIMLLETRDALLKHFPNLVLEQEAINCHHNYAAIESHYGVNVWVTRKGAVRACKGDMGIIPGNMGAKSFIVRGLGNKESFCSCSHGAGRVMSRTKAKELVSLEQHKADLVGVECNKTASTLDETPKAYKNIDDVMSSQEDLVEIVHTLKQILCIKG